MIYQQSDYSTPILPLTDLVDSQQTAQLYEYRAQRQFIQCLTSNSMLSLLLSVLPESHCSSLYSLVFAFLVHVGWRISPMRGKPLNSYKQSLSAQLMNMTKTLMVSASAIITLSVPHTFSLLFFNQFDSEMRLSTLRSSLLGWMPASMSSCSYLL